ncbi:MAG TPA: NUDIX domain-containing protein [Candidatus Nitrosocosmicus sp.]|nr:NUDIX domain-containing protein [Candidatus Nitrosocosmicus sp.]
MKFEVSAGGLVFKTIHNETHWLIIQHSINKHWGFPKGHIGDKEIGESIENAALREVEEEGGVKAKIIKKLPNDIEYFFKLHGVLIKKKLYYFLMEYESGDPKDHDSEISEAKFVTASDAKKFLSFKSDKDALEKAIELLNEKF